MTTMVQGIQITNANIANWPGATTMQNGFLSLTVVPEAARVLQCSFMGQDLFFVNEAEQGQVYPGDTFAEWHNFGGARFDVAPQAMWASTDWGKEWPPPPILNSARTGEISDNTYIMKTSGTVPNALDVGISTWINMVPGSTLIETRTELTGLAGSREWANWIVAQLAASPGGSTVYVPATGVSKHEYGYMLQMGSDKLASPIGKASYLTPLAFDYDGNEWKFGFDGRQWIAFRPDKAEDTVVALIAELKVGMNYPDDESSVEYYSAAHMPYVELELLGPIMPLSEGERISDTFRIGIARCKGNIVQVHKCGVVSERLQIDGNKLSGRFGTFFEGSLRIVGEKIAGGETEIAKVEISPERPIELKNIDVDEFTFARITAFVFDNSNAPVGVLDILTI